MQLVTFELLPRELDSEPQDTYFQAFERLEIRSPGVHRLGALMPAGPRSGDVVDLNRALACMLSLEDAGAPEAEADSLLPADMLAFLQHGDSALRRARSAMDWTRDALERYDGQDLDRARVIFPRRGVRLNAPVPRPGKVVGVARNYLAHAAERGQTEPPKEPILFIKATTAVVGPDDDVVIPRASQQVDYEGELAAVIGRRTHNVQIQDALESLAGYTVANDVTARDFQNVRGQRFIGKSCDTFAPMGPSLITADQIPDPQGLSIQTSVSGEVRQSASTEEMIFPVAEIISFASKLMTLEPGDVILTGTPAGVGAAASPPRWLADGDVVEVDIGQVGHLRSFVREEPG